MTLEKWIVWIDEFDSLREKVDPEGDLYKVEQADLVMDGLRQKLNSAQETIAARDLLIDAAKLTHANDQETIASLKAALDSLVFTVDSYGSPYFRSALKNARAHLAAADQAKEKSQ